jgi:hypothetical protein
LKADEIATAVADKLDERHREEQEQSVTLGNYRLNRWQVRFAAGTLALAVLLALAGGIRGLVG